MLRFLLRGLEKVNGEWQLNAATHKWIKFFRYKRSQQQALVAGAGSSDGMRKNGPGRNSKG